MLNRIEYAQAPHSFEFRLYTTAPELAPVARSDVYPRVSAALHLPSRVPLPAVQLTAAVYRGIDSAASALCRELKEIRSQWPRSPACMIDPEVILCRADRGAPPTAQQQQ